MISILVLLTTILPVMNDEDQRIITSLKYSKYRIKPTIIFGQYAEHGDFPFMVSIKRTLQKEKKKKKHWSNYCGGSIIQDVKVLTAAHCFELRNYYYYYHTDEMRVVAGSLLNNLIHSGKTITTPEHQWRRIENVKLHYDFHFPMNDIALVFVKSPFIYTQYVKYITPARSMTDYRGKCMSAGFGEVIPRAINPYPQELRHAKIQLMSRKQCNMVWEMNMDKFLCTFSIISDVGVGDSGGPLACYNTFLDSAAKSSNRTLLVGVVGGKNIDKTTLFTRVAAYRDWIDSNRYRTKKGNVIFLCFLIKFFCMCFGCFDF